ncbi:MAG: hypothetical protein EA349_15610 [Halomonadaceae bacterium]|nr:MAG: hypothetical protein EA349_15610 [Halomonadaceae bacterium]
MKKSIMRKSPLVLCLLAVAATVQADDARIKQLEARVDSMQQDVRAAGQDRVRFNGFMSTGIARASNDAGYDGITETSEAQSLTLFAIQGRFDISDATNATVQLVARGQDDGRNEFETQLEWGYLTHNLDNGVRLRAGQMRLPFFMYSDALELGYAQPWARSPLVVYDQIRLSNYTGADATYSYQLGDGTMRTQVFSGHSSNDVDVAGAITRIELRNLVGGVMTWTDYTWTLRGVAARADASFDFISLNDDYEGEFYGLGLEYSEGNILLISEATRRKVQGIFADQDSAYITGGYRLGNIMPYVTAAWIETQDDSNRDGQVLESGLQQSFLNVKREDYSLGVRYDIMPGIAVKADWTHSRSFGQTDGGLDNNRDATGNVRFSHTNVYTLTLDAAF